MAALVTEATLVLQDLPVTSENMMITATTAKNYAVFEEVSKTLRKKCLSFLNAELMNSHDVYPFLDKTRLNYSLSNQESGGCTRQVGQIWFLELCLWFQDVQHEESQHEWTCVVSSSESQCGHNPLSNQESGSPHMREERACLLFSLLSGYNQEGHCAIPNDLFWCLLHRLHRRIMLSTSPITAPTHWTTREYYGSSKKHTFIADRMVVLKNTYWITTLRARVRLLKLSQGAKWL